MTTNQPPFDPAAPLPDLHILPVAQSWEPAAKHYRDIEPEPTKEPK